MKIKVVTEYFWMINETEKKLSITCLNCNEYLNPTLLITMSNNDKLVHSNHI